MDVFVGFRYGCDVCSFPDVGCRVCVECKIEYVCEVSNGCWSQMFEVLNVDLIRADRLVCFALFNCLYCLCGSYVYVLCWEFVYCFDDFSIVF